jgi:Transposase IS116/IS110/IS902 family
MAELGPDMSLFPDADHCARWAGVNPGIWESAGKQLSRTDQEGEQVSAAHLGPSGLDGMALQAGVSARGPQDSGNRL